MSACEMFEDDLYGELNLSADENCNQYRDDIK